MTERPGKTALFEQFAADGITRMFGNPGTVEQGFLDAMAEHPILIERPFVVTPKGTRLARPIDAVREIL